MDFHSYSAFFAFLIFCSLKTCNAKLKFIFEKFENELEADDIYKMKLSVEKSGDIVKLSGEAVQSVDFDNDWLLNIVFYSAESENEELERVFAIADLGVCDMMISYYKMFFYEPLRAYSNAPPPTDCPVKSDNYILKDFPMELNKVVKYLYPGYYRIRSSLTHEGKEVIAYVLEFHVVDEKDVS